jgi:hypothetical protein
MGVFAIYTKTLVPPGLGKSSLTPLDGLVG